MVEALTFGVYSSTILGLYECHQLSFSFHITLRIAAGQGRVSAAQLTFLMAGRTTLQQPKHVKPHVWLPDRVSARLACPALQWHLTN